MTRPRTQTPRKVAGARREPRPGAIPSWAWPPPCWKPTAASSTGAPRRGVLGYSAAEAEGHLAIDLLGSEQRRADILDIYGKILQGEDWAGVFPVRQRDGGIAELEIHTYRIDAGSPPPMVLATAVDVRAVRAVEADLAVLDSFFSQSPVGMAVYDTETRFVQVNAALAAAHGISVAEHLGRKVGTCCPARRAPHRGADPAGARDRRCDRRRALGRTGRRRRRHGDGRARSHLVGRGTPGSGRLRPGVRRQLDRHRRHRASRGRGGGRPGPAAARCWPRPARPSAPRWTSGRPPELVKAMVPRSPTCAASRPGTRAGTGTRPAARPIRRRS